jgi:DNA polymerase III delta subunit
LVEQRTENPRVGGSNPSLGIFIQSFQRGGFSVLRPVDFPLGPRVGGSNPSLGILVVQRYPSLSSCAFFYYAWDMAKESSPKSRSKNSQNISPEQMMEQLKSLGAAGTEFSLTALSKNIGISQSLIFESESPYRLKRLSDTFIERVTHLIPTLEVERYSGSELQNEKTISSLLFDISASSLFSKAKIIFVKEADTIKVAYLSRFLDSCPPKTETCIVFICKKIPKNEAWKKLCKQSTICNLQVFSNTDLNKWLVQESKRRGASGISEEGRRYLINEVATSIEQLDHILEKASLLTNEGEMITLDTLQLLSETSLQKDSFDLFTAIAKKDILASSVILTSILQSGTHPLQLLGFFNKAIKTLLVAKGNKENQNGSEHLPELHNAWFAKKLHPERFSRERLLHALNILSELDSDMKGRNIGEVITMQNKLVLI